MLRRDSLALAALLAITSLSALGCSSTGALIITGGATPNGTVGTPYYSTLAVTGGTGTYMWTVANLPPGISASGTSTATLVLSGTPTTAGSFSIAATVVDSKGRTDTVTDGITISTSPVLAINGTLPFTGSVGTPYSGTLTATGGTAPYTWVIDNLPAGLTAAGANTYTLSVTGSPTSAGSFVVAITLTDSANGTAKASTTVAISSSAGLAITGSLPATGSVGAAYSGSLTATGGTAPYTWAMSNLPPGVTATGLDTATVSVAGSPTTAATYNVTALVTDSKQNTALYSVTVVVSAGESAADSACTGAPTPLGNEGAVSQPYAFATSSTVDSTPAVYWAGSFTPDGKGGIAAADLDEVSQALGPASYRVNLAGSSYSLGADGIGCLYLALNRANPTTVLSGRTANRELGGATRIVTSAVSTSVASVPLSFGARFKVGGQKRGGPMLQFDVTGKHTVAFGHVYAQTASDFALAEFSPRFVFGVSGWYLAEQNVIERTAMAGSIALDARSGALSDGVADNNIGGDVSGELTGASGVLGSPSMATGRGDGSYAVQTERGEVSFDFAYYVIDAEDFIFISTDPAEAGNFVLSGRALAAAAQSPKASGSYFGGMSGIAARGGAPNTYARVGQSLKLNVAGDGAAELGWLVGGSPGAHTEAISSATIETDSVTGRTTFESSRGGLPVAYLSGATADESIAGFLVGTDDYAASGTLFKVFSGINRKTVDQ